MTSIAQRLVAGLAAHGVTHVFGIPGVHTVELYRGLAGSAICHITPRHEQGAGFMADGYARVSGKPGVAFVITGPGLTNTLTAMGQARADSVPLLVVSGANRTGSQGLGLGHLHELPDQRAMAAGAARLSERIESSADLAPALAHAFALFAQARPGPAHIELPLDVAGQDALASDAQPRAPEAPLPDPAQIAQAAERLHTARAPVILAGGGARRCAAPLRQLAERLDAPVVQTVNARGVMFGHPLSVPASPSLTAVRRLIEDADLVLAIGTELGQTDYDMYDTGTMPALAPMIRLDICPRQLARHPAELTLAVDAQAGLTALLEAILPRDGATHGQGSIRAAQTRDAARVEIGPQMRNTCALLDTLRDTCPGAVIVGDSTWPVYAGNLYYDHDRPGGWFNAATGFGALGYGIPAAIGAALADPGGPVICLTGDGGAQFSLPDIMVAVEERLPVIFVVWNNRGYGEIASAMRSAGTNVIGCTPRPPDFAAIAQAYGLPFEACAAQPDALASALHHARSADGPAMIEIRVPDDTA